LLRKRVLIPYQTIRCLANRVLASRCLAMDVYSDFTLPAFGRHVTIYFNKILHIHRSLQSNIVLWGVYIKIVCTLFTSPVCALYPTYLMM
jgi:hypothetical protein